MNKNIDPQGSQDNSADKGSTGNKKKLGNSNERNSKIYKGGKPAHPSLGGSAEDTNQRIAEQESGRSDKKFKK